LDAARRRARARLVGAAVRILALGRASTPWEAASMALAEWPANARLAGVSVDALAAEVAVMAQARARR
jgi:hypothetical protein